MEHQNWSEYRKISLQGQIGTATGTELTSICQEHIHCPCPKNRFSCDSSRLQAHIPNIFLANELYKITTRIISSGMKPLMDKIINPAQFAFFPGPSILIFYDDLVSKFHLEKGPSEACMKLDISKELDNIRRNFLESALNYFKFPQMVVKWIMECIQHPSFSILVYGSYCSFLKSTHGMGRWCPLCPYLFSIVMDYGILFCLPVQVYNFSLQMTWCILPKHRDLLLKISSAF